MSFDFISDVVPVLFANGVHSVGQHLTELVRERLRLNYNVASHIPQLPSLGGCGLPSPDTCPPKLPVVMVIGCYWSASLHMFPSVLGIHSNTSPSGSCDIYQQLPQLLLKETLTPEGSSMNSHCWGLSSRMQECT